MQTRMTHAESDILYKVLLKVGFVLLNVGQSVLVQVSGHSTVLHPLQDFRLKIKQQVIDELLLLWRVDGRWIYLTYGSPPCRGLQ